MSDDDDTFLAQFEATTWPLEEWHHKQHIKVAYLYLCRYPFETAMNRIRERSHAFSCARNLPVRLPQFGMSVTKMKLNLPVFIVGSP